MQTQAIKLVENNPALWKLMNESRGVTLTQEDHKDLHKYFEAKCSMSIFEYEYYFLAGQMMTFSYGTMLAQLKKEILEEKAETSTHLIELLTYIRSVSRKGSVPPHGTQLEKLHKTNQIYVVKRISPGGCGVWGFLFPRLLLPDTIKFFYSDFPPIVYYPQSPLRIFGTSDELLFTDFWYSHVTEKRISEGRKQYAKKTGYYMGAKYILGIGGEMGD